MQRLNAAKTAIKEAIKEYKISNEDATLLNNAQIDDIKAFIDKIRPMELTIQATTVRVSASSTTNISSNPHIRILGSDDKEYTLAEWNAIFVAAGYDKTQMPVSPIGLVIDANGQKSAYLFDRYEGTSYYLNGASSTAGTLQHSVYNYTAITATGSGTDTMTGKGWSVIAHPTDANKLRLVTNNTGATFDIYKNCGNIYSQRAWNIMERTETLYSLTEWLRHRFAVNSGIETNEAAGTIGEVKILNTDGNTITSASDDMYFFVKNTNNEWVKTSDNRLAKYNLNTKHDGSAQLTQAIADAIYNIQKTNGVNMNDTGWASATKKIKSEGMKGAECISVYDSVSGKNYWYIITPYISNASATVATATNNIPDSPAIYWAHSKGYTLPSDTMLKAMYVNMTIVSAMRNYLVNTEHWVLPTIVTSDYTWTAFRSYATSCWFVNLGTGIVYYNYTYFRYCVCGARALA